MITTVTLNASIDKAYKIHGSIEKGQVMRVAGCRNTAGGKGLNVARVLQLCGEHVIATGLIGGHNGAYLADLLRQDQIENHFVCISGETRCCINILDGQRQSTELLEPGTYVSPQELDEFIRNFSGIIAGSKIVIFSGSVPLGVKSTIYNQLVHMAKQEGKTTILDTSGDLLREGIKAAPYMIKPNHAEMEMLMGRKLHTIGEIKNAAETLHRQGIKYVLVSLGKDGALMVCKEGAILAVPPKIQVANTVGCGDSMVAAFAAACARGDRPVDRLRCAVAVSAANAMSERTGYFDAALLKELLGQVSIKYMD